MATNAVNTAASREVIAAVRDAALNASARVLELAATIASIPAPTDAEMNRALAFADLVRQEGITDVAIDELGDVVARVPGRSRGNSVLIAGHLDTVFPAQTDLSIIRSNGRIHGPGIGDNSLGAAAVLALPAILRDAGIVPAVDLLLTGNVGEEGLGNLRGMRSVMEAHLEISAAIAVEGHNLGRVTHVAVGSRRLRVTVVGPGGHSWGDFGRPNAIHIAAAIIHDLSRIPVSNSPKTTLSVGTIEGGISVNTIPPTCTFVLDMRSPSDTSLRRLSERIDRILTTSRSGVEVHVEKLGERPAGRIDADSPIVRLAMDVLRELGVTATSDASSTDANIPISRGIPAICIGLTTGGNVHRTDEYIDTNPVGSGLLQLAALAVGIAEGVATGTI
ncbi:MAG: M20/M25/M40 family metallo-hydrolase [Thermomicrobiales bacterium]